MTTIDTLKQDINKGNVEGAVTLTQKAIDDGLQVKKILDDGLITAMDEVGEKFAKGALFVPQMLRSAKAMQECMELIKPFFQEGDLTPKGKILIGTVHRDLHDIGKNLVAMMLEGAGFAITDLGVDVSADQFVKKTQEIEPDIIAMSALLSTTMPGMRETIEALQRAKIRDTVKVMIGGAPVTSKFAKDIKADVYAPDAGSAVIEAKKLVGIS
jgi:5-methyltetrahydrofolate--homocysteine methyltransferase